MPHQISIIDPERMMRMWKKNRWMRPERVMALGFLALILLGGVLLGIIESLSKAYISSQMADAIVFGVLIVALGAGWYVKSNRKSSKHAA
mgnify:CR=1 FL=1